LGQPLMDIQMDNATGTKNNLLICTSQSKFWELLYSLYK